jgi:hypothetical protein
MASLLFARAWPDWIDRAIIGTYCLGVLLLPLAGYWLMVLDIRAYLRALRGALVKVVFHFPNVPTWARYETPACLRALGLHLPCTAQDVKDAYLRLAERLHPDRGGDRRKFLQLTRNVEAAIQFLRDHEPGFRVNPPHQTTRPEP